MFSCHMQNTWVCEGDCINGEGIKRWKDGGIEKGNWKDGELIGWGYQYFGKTSEFSGDSYEGNFLNSRYHGYGKYIDISEDAVYVGDWNNGKEDGKGKIVFGEKSETPQAYYDGDFKNGKWHGYGTKYWGESGQYAKNKYQGEWKNGEPGGFGTYHWADGSFFVGEWENGEQHGKGIYTFPDGEKLESVWRKGYCRELAIILWGESASTFHAFIGEFSTLSKKSGQPLIDAMKITLNQLSANPNSSINLAELKQLYFLAQKDKLSILSQLVVIEEYDSKIKLKTEFINLQLVEQELFDEFKKWFELIEKGDSFEATETINDKMYEKAVLMKKQQDKFLKLEKEFAEKYLD